MENIKILLNRLERLDIKMELTGNLPWVYIQSINGKRVTEKFNSEHGFVLGLMPIRTDGGDFNFSDINEIFSLIRKYI